MRMGTRLMQATDGFTQAVIANVEARGRAFDMVNVGQIDEDAMDTVAKNVYEQMFKVDSKGRAIISDEAVRYAAGEINMNLDNAVSNGLSEVINHIPAIKPFLLFNKTPTNLLGFFGSMNPTGLFIKQFSEFYEPASKITEARMAELLGKRGIPMDEFAQIRYEQIRAEMRGRKALGGLAVGGVAGLFMQNSITGNGAADRQVNRVRGDLNVPKKSIKIPGGSWVSYEQLGPLGDWMALTVDIMDNFETLGEGKTQQLLAGMMFALWCCCN